MAKEKKTDILVAKLLEEAGIKYEPQGSTIKEIIEALKHASKRDTGKPGFPDFTAQVGDFIIVIEDKADTDKQAKYMNDKKDTLLMDKTSIEQYAENGALHYALKVIEHSSFKKVLAFGCSGTERERLIIRPIYVSPTGYKIMPVVKDFKQFNDDNIKRYYKEKVCENKPIEQVELEVILRRASQLHEDLRNYGNLGDTEKPLVVSAILLALCEDDFTTDSLTGDKVKTDGEKIFEALSTHMDRVKVQPEVKKN